MQKCVVMAVRDKGKAEIAIPKSIRPQRVDYRTRRTPPEMLKHVLKVVNGDARQSERYEPQRSVVRTSLDQLIESCDRIEAALAGTVSRFPDKRGRPFKAY